MGAWDSIKKHLGSAAESALTGLESAERAALGPAIDYFDAAIQTVSEPIRNMSSDRKEDFTFGQYLNAAKEARNRRIAENPISSALGGAAGTVGSVALASPLALASKAPALANVAGKLSGVVPQTAQTSLQLLDIAGDDPTKAASLGMGTTLAGHGIGKVAGKVLPTVAGFMSKGRLTPEVMAAYKADSAGVRNALSRDDIATRAKDLIESAGEYGANKSAEAVDLATKSLPEGVPSEAIYSALEGKLGALPKVVGGEIVPKQKKYLENIMDIWAQRAGSADEAKIAVPELKATMQDIGQAAFKRKGGETLVDPGAKSGMADYYGAMKGVLESQSKEYADAMAKLAPFTAASTDLAKSSVGTDVNRLGKALFDAQTAKLGGRLPSSVGQNLTDQLEIVSKEMGSDLPRQIKNRAILDRFMGDRTQGSSGINLFGALGSSALGGGVGAVNAFTGGGDALEAGKAGLMGAAAGAGLGALRDKKGGVIAMKLLDIANRSGSPVAAQALKSAAQRGIPALLATHSALLSKDKAYRNAVSEGEFVEVGSASPKSKGEWEEL